MRMGGGHGSNLGIQQWWRRLVQVSFLEDEAVDAMCA